MDKMSNVFSLTDYDNITIFCLNCGKVLWTPINIDGEGKVTCWHCRCTSKIKRYRRKLQVSIFEPKEPNLYDWDYNEPVSEPRAL